MVQLDTLRALCGGHLRIFYSSIVLALIEALLVAAPYAIFYLILLDILSSAPNIKLQMSYLLLCVLFYILRFWIGRLLFLDTNSTAFKLGHQLRQEIIQKMRCVPLGHLNQKFNSGSITQVVNQDLDQTEHLFAHLLARVLSTVAILVLFSVGLVFKDWRLGLAMLSTIPCAILAFILCRKYARRWNKKIQAIQADMNDTILEFMRGMPVLRSYQMSGLAFSRLNRAIAAARKQSLKAELAGSLPALSFNVLAEMGFPILLISIMWLTLNEAVELPVLLLFLIASLRFFRPLLGLAVFIAELDYLQLAAERVNAVRHLPTLPEQEDDRPLSQINLSFENVCFAYQADSSRQTLSDIKFELAPGTLTAIVGPSGSGKSTIARLLLRFFDPDSGSIKANNRDLRGMPLEFWLSHVSLVSQQAVFLPDSIMANLRLASPCASTEEIYSACQSAQIYERIMALPEGFNTQIGDGGILLSGGECQRLAIARALLKNAEILVLDEATASQDVEHEYAIRQSIDQLAKNRSVVVIAHRLSNVVQADQILVVDDGRIIERGRHQALLELDGLYAKLWSLQISASGWQVGKNTQP